VGFVESEQLRPDVNDLENIGRLAILLHIATGEMLKTMRPCPSHGEWERYAKACDAEHKARVALKDAIQELPADAFVKTS
jgi:hypothetical protein